MQQTATLTILEAIRSVSAGRNLTRDEARRVAQTIMNGEVPDTRLAALLVALRMKGETVDEIIGFADVMRSHAEQVPTSGDDLLDTCGTVETARALSTSLP